MTARDDYPELKQLFTGWFHQDWRYEVKAGGDWPDAIDAFVAAQGVAHARASLRELDHLLAVEADDVQLQKTLRILGSYHIPRGDSRARWWLAAVREHLAASLQ